MRFEQGAGMKKRFFIGILLCFTVLNASAAEKLPDIPMVRILPGSFLMGERDGAPSAQLLHEVTLNYAFEMGKTEVTQGQWKAVMGNNPSSFKECGDDCPVENVSWQDAKLFIKRLNDQTGLQYRLPSEAEWEYACRAGVRQGGYCGEGAPDTLAWYRDNSGGYTMPAARKVPNAWGLYDMSGNVWEWVEDVYHETYAGAPTDGSAWTDGGSGFRVLRGGSAYLGVQNVRAAIRSYYNPASFHYYFGFRLARTLPQAEGGQNCTHCQQI
jgi:formylglycine-generating enzyme required for sulfatase activity